MCKTTRNVLKRDYHYGDFIMGAIASQITSLTIVYSPVYSDADQRKHQSAASLAFVRGIRRGPVNSPHKWPVTRKMFPFDDVIMDCHVCLVSYLAITHRYIILEDTVSVNNMNSSTYSTGPHVYNFGFHYMKDPWKRLFCCSRISNVQTNRHSNYLK